MLLKQTADLKALPGWPLVVCASPICQHCVWPLQIATHCKGPHHSMTSAAAIALQSQFENEYEFIQYPSLLEMPKKVDRPLPYLRYYEDGLKCIQQATTCQFVCRSEQWMLKHLSQVHGCRGARKRSRAGMLSYVSVHCQRFFVSGLKQAYFEVVRPIHLEHRFLPTELPTDAADGKSTFHRLMKRAKVQVDQKMTESTEIISELQSDAASPWLKRTQWASQFRGMNRLDLIRRIEKPEADTEMVNFIIWQAVRSMCQSAEETLISKIGVTARFEANRSNLDQPAYHPLDPYQSYGNFADNTVYWQKIFMFFARTTGSHQGQGPQYTMTKFQQRMWENVVYEAQIEGSQSPLPIAAPTGSPARVGGTTYHSSPLSSLENACLEFSMALLTQKIKVHDYDCSLVVASALLGVSNNGWDEPIDYTKKLSGIIKISRFLVLRYAYDRYREDNEAEEETEEDDDADNQPSLLGYLKKIMDRSIVRGTNGPFQWLLDLRAYGMTCTKGEMNVGSVSWNADILKYHSIELSMTQFRSMVHGLVYRTRAILMQELLFSRYGTVDTVPEIPWRLFDDQRANKSPMWNIIKGHAGRWPVDGEDWLFNRVDSTPELQNIFVRQRNGTESFDYSAVQSYLHFVQQFLDKLLVLFHITGGAPPRSPEILSVRHSNHSDGLRNLFVERNVVSYVTRYHKSMQVTGKVNLIHRYVPRPVGELVIWYLWLVLPFVRMLEQVIGGEIDVSQRLWIQAGTARQQSRKVSLLLRKEFITGTGQKIGLASYRHISIAISRKFLRGEGAFSYDEESDGEDEDADENENSKAEDERFEAANSRNQFHLRQAARLERAMDLQAAHSSTAAALIYGRTTADLVGEVASLRERYWVSSLLWHRLLGFEVALESSIAQVNHYEEMMKEKQEERLQRFKAVDLQDSLETLLGRTTRFRGIQAEAMLAIQQRKSPIIGIMGTGGGKSLLFTLPAFCSADGMTVVVVPLISLRDDMKSRCDKLGINCQIWNAKQPPFAATVVLVLPESVARQTFHDFLNQVTILHRLDRVFIDECHTILNESSSFRPSLREVAELLRARCQLILVTATLPISCQSRLMDRIYISPEEAVLIRDRTTRKNIKYVVQWTDGKGMDKYVEQGVQRLIRSEHKSGKTIVYCRTVEQTVELAALLNCQSYNSKSKDRDVILKLFQSASGSSIIAATSALGMGIDIPNIRLIIHAGRPRTMLDYCQESGRAGRDGLKSTAVVLVGRREKAFFDESAEDSRMVEEYLGVDKRCRRVIIDEYMDGICRTRCVETEEKCDLCCEREAEVALKEETESSEEEEREEQRVRVQRNAADLHYIRKTAADMQSSLQIEELDTFLNKWKDKCGVCWSYDEAYSHELYNCKATESLQAKDWLVFVRKKIQYTRGNTCWYCGVPQSICSRWILNTESGQFSSDFSQQCQYRGVVLPFLASCLYSTGKMEYVRQLWIRSIEEDGFDWFDKEEIWKYLGQSYEGAWREENRTVKSIWMFYEINKQIVDGEVEDE